MITTVYVTVKVKVKHSEEHSPEVVADEVSTYMDYQMAFDEDGIELIDTEIMGAEVRDDII